MIADFKTPLSLETLIYGSDLMHRKVFNIDPDGLPSADKAEQRSIYCQPCKRAEEFTKATAYCLKCETKFCANHIKVSQVL